MLFTIVGPYFAVWNNEEIDWNVMGDVRGMGMPRFTWLKLTFMTAGLMSLSYAVGGENVNLWQGPPPAWVDKLPGYPLFGVLVRKSYGLGVQAMCGASALVGFMPTCQPPVPQESTVTCSLIPRWSTKAWKTACAVGDRQMLPRQTKRTRIRSELCVGMCRVPELS